MKIQILLLLGVNILIFSCNDNLKERQIAVREKEVELKEKEFLVKQKDSSTVQTIVQQNHVDVPISKIVLLAKEQFNQYKKKLEKGNVAVGVDNSYTGDFTGDGKEDVLIYYGLEPTDGGNYIAGQGLVLYENISYNVRFMTDYQPNYLFTFDKINSGKIYISKEDYSDEDPRCCPSIHTIMELSLNGKKISSKKI